MQCGHSYQKIGQRSAGLYRFNVDLYSQWFCHQHHVAHMCSNKLCIVIKFKKICEYSGSDVVRTAWRIGKIQIHNIRNIDVNVVFEDSNNEDNSIYNKI